MTATLDNPMARAASNDPPSTSTKFHFSLNVTHLDSAIAFYRVLLGVAPAKCYPDYAKFEMNDPPLVMSLEPTPHAPGGALNHLGFRVPTAAALVDMQHRLEAAGIATNREDGVECCYARQTKFWVKDPDRNLWEVYVLEADTDHRGAGSATLAHEQEARKSNDAHAEKPAAIANDVAWEHQLGQPFPAAIPLGDGAADRIYLRGTFNTQLPAEERNRILREARRALRPGGRIVFHGLAADTALSDAPVQLPGPAASVSHVPARTEIVEALRSAGFSAVRIAKLSSTPVFRHENIGLRELLIEGIKLDSTPFDLRQSVLYAGPMREITDDFGNVFRRGERATIATPAVEALRSGPLAESFVFFPPGGGM